MAKNSFQNIVVAVDFSKYSKVVAKQARELAAELEIPLTFVHIINNTALVAGEIYTELKNSFFAPLTQQITSLYKLNKFSPLAKIMIGVGRPSDGILEAANKLPSPLIVIGHRGHRNFMGRLFIGSTSEQLVRQSPYPVWVHRGNSVKVPQRILLP